jgi:hypothetical protein
MTLVYHCRAKKGKGQLEIDATGEIRVRATCATRHIISVRGSMPTMASANWGPAGHSFPESTTTKRKCVSLNPCPYEEPHFMTNNSNPPALSTSTAPGFCSGSGSWSWSVIQRLTDCQNGIRRVVVISLSSLRETSCSIRCRCVILGMFRTTRCPVTATKGVQLYGGRQIRM